MGYVGWVGRYDIEDSVLVTMLRKAGAIFYVKTNVPQSLMTCETVNNVIGRTVNPRNKNWSCGGSSGGEGAIVGFRGGSIGVGTDIGGFSVTGGKEGFGLILTSEAQVVRFACRPLSTSSTVLDRVTAVYHMQRRPTVWRDRKLFTVSVGP